MAEFPIELERNRKAISLHQQQQLCNSHVAVIGCGGLGGFVAEELARIGIGRLTLYDPDSFSPSNCNRQINALESTLGQNKAEVTARRIVSIGTGCTPTSVAADFRGRLPEKDALPEVIVDCLDSIATRFELADLCNQLGIPMVHGAVSHWYGQVGVQLPGFHLPSAIFPGWEQQKSAQEPPPVLSFTVATIASFQACEVTKLLLGLPSSLHNAWMQIDLKHNTYESMPGSPPP